MTRTIDQDLLLRFTGQTVISDPAHAEAGAREAAVRRAAVKHRMNRATAAMYKCSFRLWLASTGIEPWVWALIVAAVAGFVMGIGTFAISGNRPLVVMPTMLLGFAAGGMLIYVVVQDAADETPQNRRTVRERALETAHQRVNEIAPELEDATRELERWQRLAAGIRQALELPIVRLLNANPHIMDGTEFETYLADIFRLNGYHVERLGGAGDQGVDLILTWGGERIAVQAKCYRSPLGNKPIQEVYAGRVIHGCHRWAVVTNNTFTSGGREAAAATGTILIEGSQLPALIRGQIRL